MMPATVQHYSFATAAAAKRKIHPLFVATGVNPFDAGTRAAFFGAFRKLLEANVAS